MTIEITNINFTNFEPTNSYDLFKLTSGDIIINWSSEKEKYEDCSILMIIHSFIYNLNDILNNQKIKADVQDYSGTCQFQLSNYLTKNIILTDIQSDNNISFFIPEFIQIIDELIVKIIQENNPNELLNTELENWKKINVKNKKVANSLYIS